MSDERKLGQVENSLDLATREYLNINGLLKQQIPVLLTLKPSLIDPWFQTLYYYQVKVQLRLYQVFYQIVESNFDPHQTAKQVYEAKADECSNFLMQFTITRKRKSTLIPEIDPNLPPIALGAPPPQYSAYGTNTYQSNTNSARLNTPIESASPDFLAIHHDSTPTNLPVKLPIRRSEIGTYVIALVIKQIVNRNS